MGAGKGWSPEETLTACRAYVGASEDPLSGSGKKKELFQRQVQHIYVGFMVDVKKRNAQMNYGERTGDAIVQRHRKARCECIKFEGIICSMKAKKPTGSPTEEDFFRAATAVYNGEALISNMYTFLRDASVPIGPMFPFLDCLHFFRSTEAWSLVIASKTPPPTTTPGGQGTSGGMIATGNIFGYGQANGDNRGQNRMDVTSGQSGNMASSTPQKKDRPVGKKRALEISNQVKALRKGAEGIEKLAAASEKRVKLQQRMLEIEEQKAMINLFSMQGTDVEMRAKFMQLAQEKAIQSMENRIEVRDPDAAGGNAGPAPSGSIDGAGIISREEKMGCESAGTTSSVQGNRVSSQTNGPSVVSLLN